MRGRARPGRPRLPQQRLRPHPGRRRVHRGPAVAGGRRRLGVDRGAAPAHAGGAHPVRHDLPRALPVLHGAHRAAGARLGRSDAGRRRAAAHPRRLDPDVGAARSRWRASRAQAVRDVLAAEQAAGPAHRGGARRVRRGRVAGARRPGRVPHRGAAGRARRWSGYGAPGKGNTLLNYCGIRPDLLAYTVDRNPYKHGRFTPGTRIPILAPERIAEDRPDYVLILPWNLRDGADRAAVLRARVGRPAGLPDPDPRGGLSDEGRPVLRRVRHADARRRVRPAQADARRSARGR